MHEIYYGLDFRLHEEYGISLSSVGQRLMFSVFSWAHCVSIGFSLKLLTVSELRTVSKQYVYTFDYFPVVIHWISKDASTRAKHFFLFDNSRIWSKYLTVKLIFKAPVSSAEHSKAVVLNVVDSLFIVASIVLCVCVCVCGGGLWLVLVLLCTT